MEPPSNLVFAIVAEGLFLGIVGVVVWLLITRRQLNKQLALRARRDYEIGTLRQRLQQTHQHLHAANERIKQLQSTQQDNQLLDNYKQRIANLEKFKELYFELQDKFIAVNSINNEHTEELDRYKQRAEELEATEARLQTELTGYRRRVEELEVQGTSLTAHGAVQIREVEELSTRLQQREREIHLLRQECETIGLQYEELATKSLAVATGEGDFSDEEKKQLEELKRKLEDNSAALARKQAECELLENYYLELEETAELARTTEQLQQSDAERDALREERLVLNTELESAIAPEAAAEMAKLRSALTEKEAALNEMQESYREVKEQFIEVAKEQGELRKSNETLKRERDQLHADIVELKAAREEFATQQLEMEKLRSEYSKMEARYLALVDKQR